MSGWSGVAYLGSGLAYTLSSQSLIQGQIAYAVSGPHSHTSVISR